MLSAKDLEINSWCEGNKPSIDGTENVFPRIIWTVHQFGLPLFIDIAAPLLLRCSILLPTVTASFTIRRFIRDCIRDICYRGVFGEEGFRLPFQTPLAKFAVGPWTV